MEPDGASPVVKWIGPETLEVSYDGQSQINLQVVRFCGVDIRLKNTDSGLIETGEKQSH